MELHKKIVERMKTEHDIVLTRGEIEPGSKKSYKGVLFRNTFKVDRPIVLLGVSFCGPYETHPKETVAYQISTKLVTSGTYGRKSKATHRPTVRSRLVKKGQKMRVNFLQMEILKPNVWYDIEFELNGPETQHLKMSSLKTQYVLEHEGKPILVMDSFVGSCQMLEFHFLFP